MSPVEMESNTEPAIEKEIKKPSCYNMQYFKDRMIEGEGPNKSMGEAFVTTWLYRVLRSFLGGQKLLGKSSIQS